MVQGMSNNVKSFIDACMGCALSNPHNPTTPLKLKRLPKIPWWILAVDFKGSIGPTKWYLHTVMDVYSEVSGGLHGKLHGHEQYSQVDEHNY